MSKLGNKTVPRICINFFSRVDLPGALLRITPRQELLLLSSERRRLYRLLRGRGGSGGSVLEEIPLLKTGENDSSSTVVDVVGDEGGNIFALTVMLCVIKQHFVSLLSYFYSSFFSGRW